MSAASKDKGITFFKTAFRYSKIFLLNTLRRTLILGRYTLICWQQQRLRRASRLLGTRVLRALEEGEVNPMIAEEVKDAIERARAIKAVKDRHYQAIAAIREKIRTACACEFPTPQPPPEPPKEAAPGEPEA